MIEVREVQNRDISEVYKLGENVDEFHTSDQAPNFWPEVILHSSVGKGDVYFFIAVQNDEIIGFIIANLNRSLSKALIENIFVSPNFRRQGVGLLLAKKVVSAAKADKYQFISALTPPEDGAAIRTYEKAGFSKGENFLWLDIA